MAELNNDMKNWVQMLESLLSKDAKPSPIGDFTAEQMKQSGPATPQQDAQQLQNMLHQYPQLSEAMDPRRVLERLPPPYNTAPLTAQNVNPWSSSEYQTNPVFPYQNSQEKVQEINTGLPVDLFSQPGQTVTADGNFKWPVPRPTAVKNLPGYATNTNAWLGFGTNSWSSSVGKNTAPSMITKETQPIMPLNAPMGTQYNGQWPQQSAIDTYKNYQPVNYMQNHQWNDVIKPVAIPNVKSMHIWPTPQPYTFNGEGTPTKAKVNIKNIPLSGKMGNDTKVVASKSTPNRLAAQLNPVKPLPAVRINPFYGQSVAQTNTRLHPWPFALKIKVIPPKGGNYIMRIKGPLDNVAAGTQSSKMDAAQGRSKGISSTNKLQGLSYQSGRDMSKYNAPKTKYMAPMNRNYKVPPSFDAAAEEDSESSQNPMVYLKVPRNHQKYIELTTQFPSSKDNSNGRYGGAVGGKTRDKIVSIKLPFNVSLATVLKKIYDNMFVHYLNKNPGEIFQQTSQSGDGTKFQQKQNVAQQEGSGYVPVDVANSKSALLNNFMQGRTKSIGTSENIRPKGIDREKPYSTNADGKYQSLLLNKYQQQTHQRLGPSVPNQQKYSSGHVSNTQKLMAQSNNVPNYQQLKYKELPKIIQNKKYQPLAQNDNKYQSLAQDNQRHPQLTQNDRRYQLLAQRKQKYPSLAPSNQESLSPSTFQGNNQQSSQRPLMKTTTDNGQKSLNQNLESFQKTIDKQENSGLKTQTLTNANKYNWNEIYQKLRNKINDEQFEQQSQTASKTQPSQQKLQDSKEISGKTPNKAKDYTESNKGPSQIFPDSIHLKVHPGKAGSSLEAITQALITTKHQNMAQAKEQSAPVQSAPVQSAQMQSAPVQSAPVQSAPVQSAQMQSAPVQSAPVQSAPVQSAQMQSAPVQSAPVQSAPVQSAPMQSAPVQSAQMQSAPVQSTPMQSAPVQSAPVQSNFQTQASTDKIHSRPLSNKQLITAQLLLERSSANLPGQKRMLPVASLGIPNQQTFTATSYQNSKQQDQYKLFSSLIANRQKQQKANLWLPPKPIQVSKYIDPLPNHQINPLKYNVPVQSINMPRAGTNIAGVAKVSPISGGKLTVNPLGAKPIDASHKNLLPRKIQLIQVPLKKKPQRTIKFGPINIPYRYLMKPIALGSKLKLVPVAMGNEGGENKGGKNVVASLSQVKSLNAGNSMTQTLNDKTTSYNQEIGLDNRVQTLQRGALEELSPLRQGYAKQIQIMRSMQKGMAGKDGTNTIQNNNAIKIMPLNREQYGNGKVDVNGKEKEMAQGEDVVRISATLSPLRRPQSFSIASESKATPQIKTAPIMEQLNHNYPQTKLIDGNSDNAKKENQQNNMDQQNNYKQLNVQKQKQIANTELNRASLKAQQMKTQEEEKARIAQSSKMLSKFLEENSQDAIKTSDWDRRKSMITTGDSDIVSRNRIPLPQMAISDKNIAEWRQNRLGNRLGELKRKRKWADVSSKKINSKIFFSFLLRYINAHAKVHSENNEGHYVCMDASLMVFCYKCDEFVINDTKTGDIQLVRDTLEAASEVTKGKKRRKISVDSDNDVKKSKSDENFLNSGIIMKHTPGLRNLGNTCFMNAVLQSLSNLKHFSCYFKEIPAIELNSKSSSTNDEVKVKKYYTRSYKSDDSSLVEELRKILCALWQGSSVAISPDELFAVVWKVVPRFRGYQQHDAHEFMHYLLDRVHTELLQSSKFSNGKDTIVTSIFGGNLMSDVVCLQCKHLSKKEELYLGSV
eukprot:gene10031-11056_t